MNSVDYLNKMEADELLDNIFYTSLLLYNKHDGEKCEKCKIVQGKPHKGFEKYYCKHLESKINRKLKKHNIQALELTIKTVMKKCREAHEGEKSNE